ncbi:DNA repair protein [Cyclospora cayetanensis]|uniref:DNA repair protein n=1 Tax=Cyclospora cayetanensis TaxID=88456 RepID=A0A1D3D534_9EIME|nr:DNA repair protein [Cyclospora cayetanensis]
MPSRPVAAEIPRRGAGDFHCAIALSESSEGYCMDGVYRRKADGMTTIERVGIQGVRSFGPESLETISFGTPLTVIVGHNGAGKTTLVECLKYALTGEMPPSADRGKGWLFDPRLTDSPEVKAQIRVSLRQERQKKRILVVSCNMQMIRRTAGEGRGGVDSRRGRLYGVCAASFAYKALEAVLQVKDEDGQTASISHKCVNIDEQLSSLLGISKPVLEHVVLCHQEESCWPMGDMQSLKKRFDSLFDATRYVKALQAIRAAKSAAVAAFATPPLASRLPVADSAADGLKAEERRDAARQQQRTLLDKLAAVLPYSQQHLQQVGRDTLATCMWSKSVLVASSPSDGSNGGYTLTCVASQHSKEQQLAAAAAAAANEWQQQQKQQQAADDAASRSTAKTQLLHQQLAAAAASCMRLAEQAQIAKCLLLQSSSSSSSSSIPCWKAVARWNVAPVTTAAVTQLQRCQHEETQLREQVCEGGHKQRWFRGLAAEAAVQGSCPLCCQSLGGSAGVEVLHQNVERRLSQLLPEAQQQIQKQLDAAHTQLQQLQQDGQTVQQLAAKHKELLASAEALDLHQQAEAHQRQLEAAATELDGIAASLQQEQQKMEEAEAAVSAATESTTEAVKHGVNALKGHLEPAATHVQHQQITAEALESVVNLLRKRTTETGQALAELRGAIAAREERRQQLRQDLNSATYKRIDARYLEALADCEAERLAVQDIDKYHKALDRALMSYHSAKMETINMALKELWQTVYSGADIDTIASASSCTAPVVRSAVATGEETTQQSALMNVGGVAAGERSYNYRVVMRSPNGKEIDMRGRCSAGQKVLASLVIRLALAECFCASCQLLALDEPTTNLDMYNCESLAKALARLVKARQGSRSFQLLLITHDESFVYKLGREGLCDTYLKVRTQSTYWQRVDLKATAKGSPCIHMAEG